MKPRTWLLLLDDQRGEARAHELTLKPTFAQPVAGADDLAVGTVQFNTRPWPADPAYAAVAARAGLLALHDSLRAQPGWVPRCPKILSFSAEGSVNIRGRSAELLIALHAYLDGLAHAAISVPGLPQSWPCFAATGQIDELGWVHPVQGVQAKVDAALCTSMPTGSFIFVPDDAGISTEKRQELQSRGIHLRTVRRLHEALQMLGLPVVGWWEGSPYRALKAYRVRHQAIYFGRQKDTETLCRALLQYEGAQLEHARGLGVLVDAASGAGKSSFVQAGVLAYLRQLPPAEFKPLRYAIWQPRLAWQGLEEAVVDEAAISRSVLRNWQLVRDPDATGFPGVAAQIGDKPTAQLRDLALAFQATRQPGVRYVWVVDQLEEIFSSLFVDAERLAFATFLRSLQHQGVWVIATMRAEFGQHLLQLRDKYGNSPLAEAFQLLNWRLRALESAALGEVIRGPARVAGARFEPPINGHGERLEDLIFAAASQARSAPLVGFAMHELWEHDIPLSEPGTAANGSPLLTFAGFKAIVGAGEEAHAGAGLGGVLGRVAEAAFQHLDEAARAQLERLLDALNAPAAGDVKRSDASRPAPLSQWQPQTAGGRLVQQLVRAGLLTYDELDGRPVQVRATHDLLFVHWRRASEYLKRSFEARLGIERIRTKRLELASEVAERRLLTSAADLDLARGVRDQLRLRTDEVPQGAAEYSEDLDYIDQSLAVASMRAAKTQAQRQRRLVLLSLAVLVLSCALVVAGWQGWQARKERDLAQDQRVRVVGTLAMQEVERGDAMTAIAAVLEMHAQSQGRQLSAEAEVALLSAWMLNREMAVLVGHSAAVAVAAFSPDGKRLVTTSSDNTARLWDLQGERPTSVVLQGHQGGVVHAAFSPDGKRLVTVSLDATARLWDLQGERPTSVVLEGHRGLVVHSAFSPDGKRLVTASWDNTARLWDLQGGHPTAVVLVGHRGWLSHAAFSPDGKRLITASRDNTARLWNLQGERPTSVVLEGHRGWVSHAAFNPDGKRLVTASFDNTARLWDLRGVRPTSVVLEGHRGRVGHAAFSPDGKQLVTSSHDNTARLWDLRGHRPTALVLEGHRDSVVHAAFSPDGKQLVTASRDNTARLWDVQGEPPTAMVLEGHRGEVNHAAFSPDGKRLVTASDDKTARLWNLSSDRHTAVVLEGHRGSVNHTAFRPDSKVLVTASGDNTARLWDLQAELPTSVVMEGHSGMVVHAAFNPDGKWVVTASHDATARLWDLRGERPTSVVLNGHRGRVVHATFSPDGKRLVTASLDNTARLWDLQGERPKSVALEGHEAFVYHAAFSLDGKRLVTASQDNTARLWNLQGDRPTAVVLEGHRHHVWHAAFSPDGKRLVTASFDNTAMLWDLQGERPTAMVLDGHRDSVNHAAFSPDGTLLVTVSNDSTARLWDLQGKRTTAIVLEGHRGQVRHAAFSPNSKRLVTVSEDKTARLWDLQGERTTAVVLQGHRGMVTHVVFSPDGKRLVTAADDDTARLWNVPSAEELLSAATRLQTRCLTAAQLSAFGLLTDSARASDAIRVPPCGR